MSEQNGQVELTEEQIAEFKRVHNQYQALLASMSEAIQKEDIPAFFSARAAICKFATDPEDAKEGKIVPPWHIPLEYQTIFINLEIEFILRVFAKVGLIDTYIKMTQQAKSGLIIPGRD